MSFIYETHLHTKCGSKCSVAEPEAYIELYLKKGFTGIVVTDHFFNGNCAVDNSLPWKERVDAFMVGYDRAKKEGDRQGLDVFFGFEARLGNDECLIYGVEREWLYLHPEIERANHREQYDLIHEAGGAVVQAHPYRERSYMDAIDIYPDCVDAFEGYNKENFRSEDHRAVKLAQELHIPITAGSDIHNPERFNEPFGVVSEKRWASVADYAELLRRRDPSAFWVHTPGCEERSDATLGFPVNIYKG